MCGILAEFNLSGGKSGESFSTAMSKMEHRGPDGNGVFIHDENMAKSSYHFDESSFDFSSSLGNSIRLGHRRLSIQDLSPLGNQPMSSDDGRFWIVYNGEIYNKSSIRKELEAAGLKFNSETDTEVLLKGYIHFGANILKRLKGMFAFVICDIEEKTLFIARDRFGIKPLYYLLSDQRIVFASELKQLTVYNEFSSKVNIQKALDYLYLDGLTDNGPETMFDGLYTIMPGEYAIVKESVDGIYFDKVQWYFLNRKSHGQLDDFNSFEALFKRSLDNSVNEHLLSDVPIGVGLSGGIDSSLIAAFVKKNYADNPICVSSVSDDIKYSESIYSERVADHLGVERVTVKPSAEDFFGQAEDFIYTLDEPPQSMSAFLGHHVYKTAALNGLKVMLNGQGADEYLGSYRGVGYLLAKKNFLSGDYTISDKIKGFSLSLPVNLKFSMRFLTKNYWRFLFTLKPLYGFKFISKRRIKNTKRINNKFELTQYQLFTDALPRYLRWEDRNSMRNGIEARVPFLDHELVELGLSATDCVIHKEVYKAVLRSIGKGILPDEITTRDKKGFLTPEERWLKLDNRDDFIAMMKESQFYSSGLFGKRALKRFERISEGREEYSTIYFRYLAFGLWMKVFKLKL
jgi:asparagine synthase (glutamine-hydrolysing)